MSIIYIGNFLGSHAGFYSGPNQWLVDSLIVRKFNVKYASSKLNKTGRLFDFLKLIWTERNETKLAFIDTYSTQAFYFAFLASCFCKILRLEYVLVLHGGNLPYRFKKSKYMVNWLFANAFRIIAPSTYLCKASIDAGLQEPIVIPNPIKVENYIFKSRSKLRPHLLWVRSLQSIYNPKLAIDLIAELKFKYPDIKLTIVGPDKENMLPSLIGMVMSKGLGSNVVFTGKLSLKEWTELSVSHDIFLNTTTIDNTPVSVLEAMALGLPVVSTNVGGIPFILKDGHDALLCESNDLKAMKEAVENLLKDSALVQNLCLNARRKIESQYKDSVILTQWMELISSSINGY